MKTCAYLVSDKSSLLHPDHSALSEEQRSSLRPHFEARGWALEAVTWSEEGVAWNTYDAAVAVGSWGYIADPSGFLRVMRGIADAGCSVWNPSSRLRWNLDKTYLGDLERRGVPIVPTLWLPSARELDVPRLLRHFDAPAVVVKPTISACAQGTFLIDSAAPEPQLESIKRDLGTRAVMAQPLMRSILTEGELSLFFFRTGFSHAILKRPAEGDFKVFGGSDAKVTATAEDIAWGRRVVSVLHDPWLYARVDAVRGDDGGLRLMELEMIEPYLYLRHDEAAARRFAEAFVEAAELPPAP